MPEQQDSPPNFESSLEELERVVKELEKGDLPLEHSLALFEKGMNLSASCREQLEQAETRVEILVKRGTQVAAMPFDPDKSTR